MRGEWLLLLLPYQALCIPLFRISAAGPANQAIALSLLLSIGYAIFIFTSAPTLIRFFCMPFE